MKLVVLRSAQGLHAADPGDDYVQEFDCRYADRVIGNLRNRPDFCTACGPDCNRCRAPYESRADSIAGVIDFPSVMPYVLETPGDCVPTDIPRHDILLAVNIHEQILLEILEGCRRWGTRGVVVPLETPHWVKGATVTQAQRIAEANGIEVAFPKPFCAFDPPHGSLLAEFRKVFRVGKPDVDLIVERGVITKVHTRVSAACGATYYIARWLTGRRTDEELRIAVVGKRLHTYPCTASMEWDDELQDTPLHIAGEAHYDILTSRQETAVESEHMVFSPVGKMLPKPRSAQENLRDIERAKKTILEELSRHGTVTLAQLRRVRSDTPAAVNSALLLLKQEGRIRMDGQTVVGTGE
jgi:hypothetical protein